MSEHHLPGGPFGGSAAGSWATLFEQMFEDAPLPLAVLDGRGHVLLQNAAHLAFNEIEGPRLGIGAFSVLDDPRAQERGHAAQFQRALSYETVEYEVAFEEEVQGELRLTVYQRLFVPIGSQAGRLLAVLSVLIDISDRKRAEREKERLDAQLAHTRKLESLGVLAGGIAHDFNNLLMGVMGNASIVSAKLSADSPLRKHVQAIEKAAQRAAGVAQQMLAYAGRGNVEKRMLDLSALVEDSSDLLRLSVAGRVELLVELTRDLPPLEADLTQLQQVVLNLVINACEATEGMPGKVYLRTGLKEVDAEYLVACFHGSGVSPGPFVYLEVEDRGQGIETAMLPRIFDPFFTTKLEGRGLGLAGVMGIVRGHGGAIRVESSPGEGTCFRALFPARVGASVEVTREDEYHALARDTTLLVLVVDDEELVRETTREMLRELRCKALVASSGREAVEFYRQHGAHVDLVLLDLTMPGLSGTATLRELRAIDPSVRVVIMSGYAFAEAPLEPTEAKTPFLRKPFTVFDLRRTLGASLSGK